MKTHNLLTTRNYIFGYHPHGIMGLGAFCNFSTEATGVSQKFPGIRPYLATLAGNFRMPILRDYLMSGGECKSSVLPLPVAEPLRGLPLLQGRRPCRWRGLDLDGLSAGAAAALHSSLALRHCGPKAY